ncbi:hypothetical protein QB910_000077 [Dabrowskivirus KKP3916]|uniref:Uncharacterized protein n=1 Tax=Alicyclobacillus phage KKP_3916 TaxID=3040651 RepID=A0AAT9V8A9_9CAUD|nr:hypothetical protein QB910_000077 [Alicyclobacillus phage KKP 3916]
MPQINKSDLVVIGCICDSLMFYTNAGEVRDIINEILSEDERKAYSNALNELFPDGECNNDEPLHAIREELRTRLIAFKEAIQSGVDSAGTEETVQAE